MCNSAQADKNRTKATNFASMFYWRGWEKCRISGGAQFAFRLRECGAGIEEICLVSDW